MIKGDEDFGVNERTSVPTFQEISEVFSKVKKHPHTKKISKKIIKIKKHPHTKKIGIFLGLFCLMIIICGGFYLLSANSGENSYLSGFAIAGSGISKSLTGYFTYDIDESDPNKFGVEIQAIEINLEEEEKTLNNKLAIQCGEEKIILQQDYEKEKNLVQEEINTWKNKYESCKDALDDCEDS
jgi:hypothetical protein